MCLKKSPLKNILCFSIPLGLNSTRRQLPHTLTVVKEVVNSKFCATYYTYTVYCIHIRQLALANQNLTENVLKTIFQ